MAKLRHHNAAGLQPPTPHYEDVFFGCDGYVPPEILSGDGFEIRRFGWYGENPNYQAPDTHVSGCY